MTEQTDNGTRAATAVRPALRIDKVVVLCLMSLGTIVLTYMAWYRLMALLWAWANAALWHWVPAALALMVLLLAPPLAFIGTVAIVRAKPRTRRLYWWSATALLAALALGLLILWAFLPAGDWWRGSYWWIWSVLVVAGSILGTGARMFTVVQPVGSRKPRDTLEREWRFNHGDVHSPPALGLALSGGGIRSAAFNLGVLQALHEAAILRQVDVMSAVSGGTYIMSWYLLQPFYAARADADTFELTEILDEMFDPNGRFQAYLRAKPQLVEILGSGVGAAFGATLEQPLRTFASIGDDLDQFNSGFSRRRYRQSIQELFQGHPRKEAPEKIGNAVGFPWGKSSKLVDFATVAPVTYRELAAFAEKHNLPFFIFNCATLVDRAFRHMLWPTAFELTADDFGTESCGYRRWEDLDASDEEELRALRARAAEMPTLLQRLDPPAKKELPGQWIKLVNLASAISGAAIGLARFDANKPERSMKLATWMPFVGNIDIGYLFPAKTLNTESPIYVSDGGHAENLGAYALIRRRCHTIVIVDAEHEPVLPYAFEAYCKLKDRLLEEEALLLQIDAINAYLASPPAAPPTAPPTAVMTGRVAPAGDARPGQRVLAVVYVKLGLDRGALDALPPEVRAYAMRNERFPQDPTTDQRFTSEQFTAYRVLGHHAGSAAVADIRSSRKCDVT
jgi:hypothetical protein